ncbi:MAG: hypothetical protein DRJ08_06965, partial [Acidobacteria bacterium]
MGTKKPARGGGRFGVTFGRGLNGGHAHPNVCFHFRGVEGRWPEMETVSTNEYNANSVPDSGSGNPVFSRECKAENVNLACLPLPEWQKSPSIRL